MQGEDLSNNPLIVALDTPSTFSAVRLVKKLKITGVGFKIGFELFSHAGPRFVKHVVGHDVRVFLDLKFHDIPNTVARAVDVATRMGVWMLNVHCSGGGEMMKVAREARDKVAASLKTTPPLLVGVTFLTSLSDPKEIQISSRVEDYVLGMAHLAKNSGLDGVVASGQEAALIRRELGPQFVIVTPGIRPLNSKAGDQKRILTPKEAINQGSNYLVVGRPITEAPSPLKAVDNLLNSLS